MLGCAIADPLSLFHNMLFLLVSRTVGVWLKACLSYQAELIKGDLDKAVQKGSGDVQLRRGQSLRYNVTSHEYSLNWDEITLMRSQISVDVFRSNLESIIGQHAPGSQAGFHPVHQERYPPPLDYPAPQFSNRELGMAWYNSKSLSWKTNSCASLQLTYHL